MDLLKNKKLFLLPFIYYYSLSIVVLIIGVYLLAKVPPSGGISLSFASNGQNQYANPEAEILLSSNDEFSTTVVKDLETGNTKCNEKIAGQINSFFTSVKAPLSGFGCDFVSHAESNKVDPYIVSAIAMCESGGGKNTNYEFNAWGYGVTSSKSVNDKWGAHVCNSWEDCIGRVTRAIARNSHKGDTPKDIAQWYNGGDKEKWTSCVNQYIEAIKAQ